MTTCPCCGQPVEATSLLMVSLESNVAARNDHVARLSPREAEVLWLLNDKAPAYVGRDRLCVAIYGRHVVPMSIVSILSGLMGRLRRKLAPLGGEVFAKYDAGYRLVLH